MKRSMFVFLIGAVLGAQLVLQTGLFATNADIEPICRADNAACVWRRVEHSGGLDYVTAHTIFFDQREARFSNLSRGHVVCDTDEIPEVVWDGDTVRIIASRARTCRMRGKLAFPYYDVSVQHRPE